MNSTRQKIISVIFVFLSSVSVSAMEKTPFLLLQPEYAEYYKALMDGNYEFFTDRDHQKFGTFDQSNKLICHCVKNDDTELLRKFISCGNYLMRNRIFPVREKDHEEDEQLCARLENVESVWDFLDLAIYDRPKRGEEEKRGLNRHFISGLVAEALESCTPRLISYLFTKEDVRYELLPTSYYGVPNPLLFLQEKYYKIDEADDYDLGSMIETIFLDLPAFFSPNEFFQNQLPTNLLFWPFLWAIENGNCNMLRRLCAQELVVAAIGLSTKDAPAVQDNRDFIHVLRWISSYGDNLCLIFDHLVRRGSLELIQLVLYDNVMEQKIDQYALERMIRHFSANGRPDICEVVSACYCAKNLTRAQGI